MAIDWKMRLYQGLPVWLQEAGLSAYAWHLDRLYYGPIYEQELGRIMAHRFDSPDAVRAFQEECAVEMVAQARAHSPYYRTQWAQHGPVRSLDDLRQMPLLDKQRIRQHELEFVDERFDPRRMFCEKTSGTTGTSLKIFWDKSSIQKLWAANEVRVRRVAGVDRFTPRAMVGGRPIVPGHNQKPPFWRYNYRWRQLYLSSYHIASQWTREYVAAIRRAGSKWITGYGSAIAALAENAISQGLDALPLKAVIVSGDTLQPGMREPIEAFFQCRCYDHYGQSEGVCWIMECPNGRMHVAPEVGVLEILDDQGQACPPGVPGEMVVTGLLNRAMPLIRYRTSDEAAWAADQTCTCGQPFPIVERIEGRVDDYLVTKDGRRIGRLSTAMKGSPRIHSAQIVQDCPGHAWLLIRPGEGYCDADGAIVKADILSRIGVFMIDVVVVREIPRTPVGKTKLVIRLSDKPELWGQYTGLVGRNESRTDGMRVGAA